MVYDLHRRENDNILKKYRVLSGRNRIVLFVLAAALVHWHVIFDRKNLLKFRHIPQKLKSRLRGRYSQNEVVLKSTEPVEEYEYATPAKADSWPKVALLMSFPNSGTSYTGKLVRRATLTITATNYGYNNLDEDGNSIPLYDWSPIGPFVTNPEKERNSLPDGQAYILTKTHCGGTCFGCPPKKYLLTQQEFQDSCLESNYKEDYQKKKAIYDPSIVSKAVHLIRNPFDNVVSRFHLKRNQMEGQGEEGWLAMYPNTRDGFRAFCSYFDSKFHSQEKNVIIGDNNSSDIFVRYQNIPCVSEFVRWTLWHNNAVRTTNKLGVEAMVLHYEDYGIDLQHTTNNLLDFLGLEFTHKLEKFRSGSGYSGYFESKEVNLATSLIKELVDEVTWPLLERYFS